MKVGILSNSKKPKRHFIAAILSFLKNRPRSHLMGSAMVELSISLPVALTVVLGSVHLSVVMREANIIVEAARHGARSAAAQSGISDPAGAPNSAPDWSSAVNSITATCARDGAGRLSFLPSTLDLNSAIYGHQVATIATCDYLAFSDPRLESDGINWSVTAGVIADLNGGGVRNFPAFQVTVTATNPRGPVDSLKTFFNILPSASSTYPLLRAL